MTTATIATRAPQPPGLRGSRSRTATLALGLLAAVGLLVLVAALGIAVGSKAVPLGDVWRGLVNPDDSYNAAVIASRIPRTQLGLLVGAALAVAGAVIQGLTRNPLGDPGLLGVNAGASMSVVLVTAFVGVGAGRTVWAAVPGAVLAAVVVYVVGTGRAGSTPVRLILAGAAVSAVLVAVVQAVSLARPDVFDSYRFWAIGSLSGRTSETVGQVAWFVVVGLVVCLAMARALNAVELGDQAATSLGLAPGRTKAFAAVGATVLCAAAVAAAGPIGFVGLAVPHVVRSFTGADHRWLLPYCAVLGPVLVIGSDVLGRVIARPGELMVGAITAFVGAPFLIAAVRGGRVGL